MAWEPVSLQSECCKSNLYRLPLRSSVRRLVDNLHMVVRSNFPPIMCFLPCKQNNLDCGVKHQLKINIDECSRLTEKHN